MTTTDRAALEASPKVNHIEAKPDGSLLVCLCDEPPWVSGDIDADAYRVFRTATAALAWVNAAVLWADDDAEVDDDDEVNLDKVAAVDAPLPRGWTLRDLGPTARLLSSDEGERWLYLRVGPSWVCEGELHRA